jgi:uncharacterized membrane protein
MSNKHPHSALEKEFELERLILFSDAVFAIAITLLIIDIKFPELPAKRAEANTLELLKPTLFSFLAFALSFFFIGRSWSNHLRLFRLLRKYDQGLINRNLLFLFFIVTFPFAAAGIAGHVQSGFIVPIYVYIINLAAVSIAHFNLCHYIIRKKPQLTVEGETAEKKFVYFSSQYIAAAMGIMVIVIIAAGLIFPDNESYVGFSCILVAPLLGIAKRKAKKYQPVEHS